MAKNARRPRRNAAQAGDARSSTAASCARSSARPPRRSSSPRATSTTAPRRPSARFNGEEPGFIYSRFANPTVAMFEERMRLLEGAEAARATASGMAAVTAAFLCQLKAGDHVVAAKALFGSLPLRGRGAAAALRHRARRWSTAPTSTSGEGGDARNDQGVLPRKPDQPDARSHRHRGGRRDRPQGRRAADRRQRLRDAAPPEAARSSAPTSSSIRRPSISTARAAASAASSSPTRSSSPTTSTRSSARPARR